MTRAERLKQKETARLYREMVAAVRRWVEVACPDDFADRPLAYRAFLANGLKDIGVRLTWLAPTTT